MKPTKETRKLHWGWNMFDWANSAYNLVITSTIFPAYYLAVAKTETSNQVSFFGWETVNSAMLNYALAFAYFIVAIISPILSSIADYRGTKKRFMKIFTYMGGGACCLLFFFNGSNIEFGLIMAVLAAIGFSGGLVFYNAYLPEIAEESEHDKLSAKGFAYGYVGSVILQLICFAFFVFHITSDDRASRLSFLLVGLWWIGFAQIPFALLPKGIPAKQNLQHSIIYNGFHELKYVWQQLNQLPVVKIYLVAFFFYSMGVQTVMLAAAEFAVKEIKHHVTGAPLSQTSLIIITVIIQLVAIVGALLMASLSKVIGNIKVLMLTVLLWIGVCIIAYFIYTDIPFYFLAALVGLVMGGIQSMSRSTYSKMMPPIKDTASFFSFYNVAEKVGMALGLFTFGLMEHITGSMRNSVFALGIFFLIGFVFLVFTQRQQNRIPGNA